MGSCLIWAGLHWCFDFFCLVSAYTRGKAEEKSGRDNSGFLLNAALHCCCHCCAVLQETRAVGGVGAPEGQEMAR